MLMLGVRQMGHRDGPWPKISNNKWNSKNSTYSNGTRRWPLAREFRFEMKFNEFLEQMPWT